jgi:hypothetical protein
MENLTLGHTQTFWTAVEALASGLLVLLTGLYVLLVLVGTVLVGRQLRIASRERRLNAQLGVLAEAAESRDLRFERMLYERFCNGLDTQIPEGLRDFITCLIRTLSRIGVLLQLESDLSADSPLLRLYSDYWIRTWLILEKHIRGEREKRRLGSWEAPVQYLAVLGLNQHLKNERGGITISYEERERRYSMEELEAIFLTLKTELLEWNEISPKQFRKLYKGHPNPRASVPLLDPSAMQHLRSRGRWSLGPAYSFLAHWCYRRAFRDVDQSLVAAVLHLNHRTLDRERLTSALHSRNRVLWLTIMSSHTFDELEPQMKTAMALGTKIDVLTLHPDTPNVAAEMFLRHVGEKGCDSKVSGERVAHAAKMWTDLAAKYRNIGVRGYRSSPTMQGLLVSHEWAVIELLPYSAGPLRRPALILTQRANPEAFATLSDAIDKLWDDAEAITAP